MMGNNPLEAPLEKRHSHLEYMMGYFEEVGRDTHNPDEKRDCETDYKVGEILRLLDTKSYVVGIQRGYFQALELQDLEKQGLPQAGLKIHISVSSAEPYYLDVIGAVRDVCSGELPTSFKIMTSSSQRTNGDSNPDPFARNQGRKVITIYPKYRGDDGALEPTNVPETLRIIRDISTRLRAHADEMSGKSIDGDLEVMPGIFIRPGPFTERGMSSASSDASLGFAGQLSRLQINQEDFRRELSEAGVFPKQQPEF